MEQGVKEKEKYFLILENQRNLFPYFKSGKNMLL